MLMSYYSLILILKVSDEYAINLPKTLPKIDVGLSGTEKFPVDVIA